MVPTLNDHFITLHNIFHHPGATKITMFKYISSPERTFFSTLNNYFFSTGVKTLITRNNQNAPEWKHIITRNKQKCTRVRQKKNTRVKDKTHTIDEKMHPSEQKKNAPFMKKITRVKQDIRKWSPPQ